MAIDMKCVVLITHDQLKCHTNQLNSFYSYKHLWNITKEKKYFLDYWEQQRASLFDFFEYSFDFLIILKNIIFFPVFYYYFLLIIIFLKFLAISYTTLKIPDNEGIATGIRIN